MRSDRVTEYLDEVARELPRGWPVREAALRDLRLHIDSAVEEGADEQEALARLGPPTVVAYSILEEYRPRLAPLSHRIAAFLVDAGIGWAVIVAGVATGVLISGGSELVPFWLALGWGITAAIMTVIYFPAFEATLGRTPGKMLAGLHVVRTDGHPVGWKEAVIRRLPLFFEFFWLDALFAPFTEKKQRAFDMVAGTLVVQGSDEGRPGLAWVLGIVLLALPLVYVALVNNLI